MIIKSQPKKLTYAECCCVFFPFLLFCNECFFIRKKRRKTHWTTKCRRQRNIYFYIQIWLAGVFAGSRGTFGVQIIHRLIVFKNNALNFQAFEKMWLPSTNRPDGSSRFVSKPEALFLSLPPHFLSPEERKIKDNLVFFLIALPSNGRHVSPATNKIKIKIPLFCFLKKKTPR